MKKLLILTTFIATMLLLFSCKTYTIPIDSFREQMIKTETRNMKEVEINNPLTFHNIKYHSNNINQIIVIDKDGKKMYLKNSPSIEMRVTHVNGKKYHFYFDTVKLENDTLKGGRSRFVQGLTREIPLNDIVKIEVQDGGKKYNYQN
jgi:MFS superfamily sulfate permease-like transporter